LNDAMMSRIDAHLGEEREAASGADRAASVRLSGEFHVLLVDSLKSPELSHFLRELLARSSLMVSAFEPARLSLCSVDEHAAIAEALKARNVERAIALSNEHFTHIEDRLAQGIVERVERRIEDALEPLVPGHPRSLRPAIKRVSAPVVDGSKAQPFTDADPPRSIDPHAQRIRMSRPPHPSGSSIIARPRSYGWRGGCRDCPA
jgi:hypothetical protein